LNSSVARRANREKNSALGLCIVLSAKCGRGRELAAPAPRGRSKEPARSSARLRPGGGPKPPKRRKNPRSTPKRSICNAKMG